VGGIPGEFNKELHMNPADLADPKPALFGQIRAVCYAELKGMPEFEEAQDI
jgi:hypothetical protein